MITEKMAKEMLFRAVVFLFSLLHVADALQCGNEYCYQTGAYCCGDMCCFSIWSYWWFWMIWVLVLLFISCCSYAARRRYRAQPRYIVIQHPDGQAYGFTSSGTMTNYQVAPAMYGTLPTQGAQGAMAPQGPVKPPAYTNDKPPAYNAAYNAA